MSCFHDRHQRRCRQRRPLRKLQPQRQRHQQSSVAAAAASRRSSAYLFAYKLKSVEIISHLKFNSRRARWAEQKREDRVV